MVAYPTGIETHVEDRLLDLRQAPAVARVEQKTCLSTEGVLTEVALGSPGRFPAFDALLALAVGQWTAINVMGHSLLWDAVDPRPSAPSISTDLHF